MKKVAIPIVVVPLVVYLALHIMSCQVISDCLECLCGDVSEGDFGITGNAKVDSFFAAAIELDASTQLANMRMEAALSDLAVALGLTEDADLDAIRDGLADSMAGVSLEADLQVEPPRCEADINVAVQAAAECDVDVDPGSVEVRCEGHCSGTCYAQCDGECRIPSVEAYCEGSCHGSCYVDIDTECWGTCHGECDGNCTYLEEGGQCAGACDGVCTGYCETRVEGDCTGECYGECTVTADPGGCNGHCEGGCQGHCEGGCEGEIVPPSVDVDCQAQVEARVEASVECEPAEVTLDIDTSGIDNFLEIMYHVGRVYAAAEEAGRIHASINGFVGTFGGALTAIINGEVDSTKAACAILEADDAAAILNDAIATLNGILEVHIAIGLPPLP